MNVYIETLGCPKNENDSELVVGLLERENHKIVLTPEESNMIIVNTCGFINDAKKESVEKILEMASLKDIYNIDILAVTGCLSKRYEKELFKEIPEIDILLGVNEYYEINKIIEDFNDNKIKSLDYRFSKVREADKEFLEIDDRVCKKDNFSATLRIAEGCDNTCAYCVIPEIRGHYRSRKLENIVKEGKKLADEGVKELILIAQDVTAYGLDIYGKYELPKLIEELCKIDKIKWIRLMYCYEERITDELIEVMKNQDKVCKYIDIPLQHGSNKILKLMRRRSTEQSIRRKIAKLRDAIPNISIRTTIITGFPGETVKEFQELTNFIKDMKFDRLGVFAYSKEENTVAGKMKPQVRSDVKERRKNLLMQMQMEISLKLNQAKIGQILEVVVEDFLEDGSYLGRTEFDAPEIDNGVIFESENDLQIGEIVKVKITDAFDYDLVGEEVV